jgi:membrane-bound lytic murein transglycosylase F
MRFVVWLALIIGLTVSACSRIDPPGKLGELVVAVPADPVFYQAGASADELSGIEHDLAQAFADDLGVKLRFIVARDITELGDLVRSGKAHYAAAMPMTREPAGLRFSAPLREVRQLLVQHDDSLPLDDDESLVGQRIEVLRGSPQIEAIRSLEVAPAPEIVEAPQTNAIDLLARVAIRDADLVAVDSVHFDIGANYYPELAIALELPGTTAYAWAFHAGDESLAARADDFIARSRQNGLIARLDDRYFGHVRRINAVGAAAFLDHVQTRLPRYRVLFHEAQLLSGVDWRLLAALAYQESRWDPLATSPTGVRGMMMLTEDTADRLRVGNRLDPRQSIIAGSRYFADLRDQLPPEVKEPDRTWMALAAYNLGMGHMNGARQFAMGLKRDPASWYDMKKVLPLLARPEYYRRLKSGRARGGEAVIMAENIRTYQGILNRFEPPYVPVVKPPDRR